MSVYKDKTNGTWYAEFRYYDWNGEHKRHKKRGFATQREAKDYERDFLNKSHTDKHLTFKNLSELYLEDCKARLKATTHTGKASQFEKHLIPYFGRMHIEQIKPQTVRRWQTEMIQKGFKDTYLKSLHNQLSAVFNYAVRYCGLPSNPARECGAMGSKSTDKMQFWTIEEFNTFVAAVSDKLYSHVLFNLLFWTGMRSGEALALTPKDIDLDGRKIHIDKSYTRLHKQDIITRPKTKKSIRTIEIPPFLADMLQSYAQSVYGLKKTDRMFPYTKYFLNHEMKRGCKLSGVKKIRIHDLRHSHASLLIHMDVPVLLISERLGHKNIETTLQTYSHLYPSRLNDTMMELERLHNNAENHSQNNL